MKNSKITQFILSNDPGYYSEEFLEQLESTDLEDIKMRIEEILVWKKELKNKNIDIMKANQSNKPKENIIKQINKPN